MDAKLDITVTVRASFSLEGLREKHTLQALRATARARIEEALTSAEDTANGANCGLDVKKVTNLQIHSMSVSD